jgi:hypothetical protein
LPPGLFKKLNAREFIVFENSIGSGPNAGQLTKISNVKCGCHVEPVIFDSHQSYISAGANRHVDLIARVILRIQVNGHARAQSRVVGMNFAHTWNLSGESGCEAIGRYDDAGMHMSDSLPVRQFYQHASL